MTLSRIDMLFELETRWKEVQKFISDFLMSQGMDGITSKEMAVMPGMELMSALFYVLDFYKKGDYDVVVLDTAPTAETLRLLSFPEVSNWYSERLYGMVRNMLRVARLTVGKFMNTPLPSEDLLKDLEELGDRMKQVQKVLTNPEITSIRLVVNPEKMVINETKRAFTYLCLYNLTVECIVVNRMMPEGSEGYFKGKNRRTGTVYADNQRIVQSPSNIQSEPASRGIGRDKVFGNIGGDAL